MTELPQSAQTAHLQDLQHQISTKTLALQTLQREHDNLLAAFSRSQVRCATLEKKFQVSDTEINTLTEERLKLSSQIEAFETQVEELIVSREEARKQSVANGGQYMKIMAMASKLEAQSRADKTKWTSEKEEWEKEKEGYRRELQAFRNGKAPDVKDGETGTVTLPPPEQSIACGDDCPQSLTFGLAGIEPPPEGEDPLDGTCIDTLRREIIRLRKGCHDMEHTLRDLSSESQQATKVAEELGSLCQRITTKTGAGAGSCKWLNPVKSEHVQPDGGAGSENTPA